MAQDSAFWDDGVGGDDESTDVWSSRYSDTEYADVWSKILGSNSAVGYVIPDYANNLTVTENTPAAMNVLVDTGAAFVRGWLYENTAQATVTIAAADPANPRIDRVVLQVSTAAQEVRLAVVTGTPAATPALPALTQTAATYQVDLAHVWVAAAAASITDEDISDQRQFASDYFGIYENMFNDNLIVNSEFMAYSALGGGAAPTDPPDYWELHNTPTMASATRPTEMARGRAIQITADAATEGLSQTIQVCASTMYAIKYLLKVTTGDTATVTVTTDAAAPATITRTLRRTNAWLTWYEYYETEADATELTVTFDATANTDIIEIGQVIVVQGYIPGPFRQFHETLPFCYRNIQDTDWDGDAVASGNYTIDFSVDFGGLILTGTTGVMLNIGLRDGVAGIILHLGQAAPIVTDRAILSVYTQAANVASWANGWFGFRADSFTLGLTLSANSDNVYIFVVGITT